MKHSLKAVALLAALTFALQPLASCFSEEMTVSEAQCCREMAGDCGIVSMPTSHSCCKYVDRADSARPELKNTFISNSLLAVVPSFDAVPDQGTTLIAFETSAESPPQLLSESIQILRI